LTASGWHFYDSHTVRPGRAILIPILSLAVLLAGIDCPCVKAVGRAGQTAQTPPPADADAMPCCVQHAGHGCGDRPPGTPANGQPPCGGSCERCGKTVISEPLAAPAHCLAFAPHPLAPILAIEPALWHATDPRARAAFVSDSPPLIASPTLLSLHCALTN